MHRIALLLLCAPLWWVGASAEDVPIAKLGQNPGLKLQDHALATADEAKHIEALIAQLASVDSPDYGFSATLSGSAFLPIDGQTEAGTLLLTDHNLQQSKTLRELVEFGPKALPHLLKALDDRTESKLST